MPIFWFVIAALGLSGLAASIFGRRSARAARDEGGELWRSSRPLGISAAGIAQRTDLPVPVRRWLTMALGGRTSTPGRAFVRHEGTFTPAVDRSSFPIVGRQWFTADPPGFIWWGRVRLFPGVWIDARDRFENGRGSMRIRAESLVTIGDVSGAEIDQSAALRLLGELAFLPSAYLDDRYVRWADIDYRSARAQLTTASGTVEATFEFGGDGVPTAFRCDRYRDAKGGPKLTPFVGTIFDWRRVDGVLVPFALEGTWVVDGKPFTFARWKVREVRFEDAPAGRRRPFRDEAPVAHDPVPQH